MNKVLELCKEISNTTECSIEEALTYVSIIIDSTNSKKLQDSNIDFTYSDLNKENRIVNAFIDYFIETNGKINIKGISEKILKVVNKVDDNKLKEMRKVFHNIEDIKFKIDLLKNFNDLSLFRKEGNEDFFNLLKLKLNNSNQEPLLLYTLFWQELINFYGYLIYYRFFGENKTYKNLLGNVTNHTEHHGNLVKQRRIINLSAYEFIFENIPYFLTEYKISTLIKNSEIPYHYKSNNINKLEVIAMCLEEGTLFELIKYKKRYYDSIKKKYPIAEGKTIYKANSHNQGDNKEEIDNFLEETFGLNKLNTLIKKDNVNNEI